MWVALTEYLVRTCTAAVLRTPGLLTRPTPSCRSDRSLLGARQASVHLHPCVTGSQIIPDLSIAETRMQARLYNVPSRTIILDFRDSGATAFMRHHLMSPTVADYRGYHLTLLSVREINLEACARIILTKIILYHNNPALKLSQCRQPSGWGRTAVLVTVRTECSKHITDPYMLYLFSRKYFKPIGYLIVNMHTSHSMQAVAFDAAFDSGISMYSLNLSLPLAKYQTS